jgi:hypothetical protein
MEQRCVFCNELIPEDILDFAYAEMLDWWPSSTLDAEDVTDPVVWHDRWGWVHQACVYAYRTGLSPEQQYEQFARHLWEELQRLEGQDHDDESPSP